MNNKDSFYRIEIVTKAEEVPETSADLRLFLVVDGSLRIRKEERFCDLAKSDRRQGTVLCLLFFETGDREPSPVSFLSPSKALCFLVKQALFFFCAFFRYFIPSFSEVQEKTSHQKRRKSRQLIHFLK